VLAGGTHTIPEIENPFINEVGNVLLDSTLVSLIYLEVLKQL